MKKNISHQRSGIILILALLLMAAITASTIGVSVVINTTASQSKNLDNFIIASLAADSGLERSLAVVKAARQRSSLSAAVLAVASGNTPLGGNSAIFSVVAAESSAPITIPILPIGQSFSFDILKPAVCPPAVGTPPITPECPPSKLLVTGGDTTAGTSNLAILDISWVLIDANGNTNNSGRAFRSYTNFQAASPVIIDLNSVVTEDNAPIFFGGSSLLGYRVTVRALNGVVNNVTATPYGAPYNASTSLPAQIPSNVSITSTGIAGTTRSIKIASILWQLPTSKLFNYVLFTEGPIISCGSQETTCN